MSWPPSPRNVTGGVLEKQRLRWCFRSQVLSRAQPRERGGAGLDRDALLQCWPDKAVGRTLEQVLPIRVARPVTPPSLRLWLQPTQLGCSSATGAGPGVSDHWGLHADCTPGPIMHWGSLVWAHRHRVKNQGICEPIAKSLVA